MACFSGVVFFFKVYSGDHFHLPAESEKFEMINALGLVGMALLQQGYPWHCRLHGSRGLLLTICLTLFLAYGVYCATLTSHLTAEKTDPTVENLDVICLNGLLYLTM